MTNKRPQFALQTFPIRAGSVLDAHQVGRQHVISQRKCEHLSVMALCANENRPQSTRIDIFYITQSWDLHDHYFGNVIHHMLVFISPGSHIRCGIPLEFWRHREEGKQNLFVVALFVPDGGMDIPNGQVHRPGLFVAGGVCELYLIRFTDRGTIVPPDEVCSA
jgi:hypothetical protein